MKKTTLIITLVLSLVLSSCNKNDNNKPNTVTLTDKESGTKITASVNDKKVPDNFPSDIYIIKGKINQVTIINMEEQQNVSFYISTELTTKEIRTEILKNMESNGWTTKMNVHTQQYYSKNNKALRVGFSEDKNITTVMYVAAY